jgi:hypothetical protein
MDSQETLTPLEPTKKSVEILKRTFGVSIVVDLGIGLVSMLATLAWIALVAFGGTLLYTAGVNVFGLTILGSVAVVALVAMIVVFSTLSMIATTAIYYHAVTGTVPQTFESEVLRAAITPKKAKKIFSN